MRKLVEMMISVNRSMLVALHLGRLKDTGKITPAQVSLGKMDNVRQALEIAREGTNEIHTLALGHAITGTAAYR